MPCTSPPAQEMDELIAKWAAHLSALNLPAERVALLARERARLAQAAAEAGVPDFSSDPMTAHRLALRHGRGA